MCRTYQWSPCGSQPADSVGLGPGSSAAAAATGAAVCGTAAGPSQCLEVSRQYMKEPDSHDARSIGGLPVVSMRLAAHRLGRRWTWILLRRSESGKGRKEEANEGVDSHRDGGGRVGGTFERFERVCWEISYSVDSKNDC